MAMLLLGGLASVPKETQEAAEIDTPSSISAIKVPDDKIMMISIGSKGEVFFGVDAQPDRIAMLNNIAESKGMTFTDVQKKKFSNQASFGFPLAQLKGWLDLPGPEMGTVKQPGIPTDSTGVSELADWIYAARKANPMLRIAIKGDNSAKFPTFKNVLLNLQSQNINRFNLITDSEEPPAGWKAD